MDRDEHVVSAREQPQRQRAGLAEQLVAWLSQDEDIPHFHMDLHIRFFPPVSRQLPILGPFGGGQRTVLAPHLAQAPDHVVQLTARHFGDVARSVGPGFTAARVFTDVTTIPVVPAAAIAIAIATAVAPSAVDGVIPKDGMQVGSPKGPIDATAIAKRGLAPPRRAHAVRVEAYLYAGFAAAGRSAAVSDAAAAATRRRRPFVLPPGQPAFASISGTRGGDWRAVEIQCVGKVEAVRVRQLARWCLVSAARRPWLIGVTFLRKSVLIDCRTGGMSQDKGGCADDVTVHCSVTTFEPYKSLVFFVALLMMCGI